MAGGVVHIAGQDIRVNDRYLRQRCAWCGAALIDVDLTALAVPVGQDPTFAVWPLGALVEVDGLAKWVVDNADRLPENCCATVDPAATR